MDDADFAGKPIVAVADSFTRFVPGHVHLRDLRQIGAPEIEAAGDGAMARFLPSRERIADWVGYMINTHCADKACSSLPCG